MMKYSNTFYFLVPLVLNVFDVDELNGLSEMHTTYTRASFTTRVEQSLMSV
jgi:hypothetical protein